MMQQYANDVETVLTFGRTTTLERARAAIVRENILPHVTVVKRQDRHEDGSISTTYYLEITSEQYKALGGE